MTLEAMEGQYKIYSEKEDACLSESAWSVVAVGLIGTLILIVATLFLFLTGNNSYPLFLIGTSASLIISLTPSLFRGCGVKITLKDFQGKEIDVDTYKFTGDTEKDAAKIKQMITRHVNRAKQLAERDAARYEEESKAKEKQEQRKARYESIIEKARKL